jgi:hypothetical protein
MKTNFRHLLIGTLAAGAGLLVSALGAADTSAAMDPGRHAGRASVYRNLPAESLEATTPPDRIKAVASGRYAPTEIWRALEHGEKVECMSCIPEVSKLLWNNNAKTREISAWWLRRRIIGVFGPGQIYSQVVATLQTSPDETRRAYAADALGEFLSGAGVKYVSKAIREDSSAKVRKSAVMALMRLNSRVMRSADGVVALSAITSPETESNAGVRAAAVAALGKIADPGGKAAVQNALNDPNQFVRDAANIAMRRL